MKVLSKRLIGIDDTAALPTGKKEDALRTLREPLLAAFDIYKQNVNYGILTETAEEHASVTAWYKKLCDLEPEALRNVPYGVEKYVKRNKKGG